MRTAFIQELIQQARLHPEVFLVVGDLGFSVVEPFAKEFPDRYLNAGIAEQNMTGVAAGLASEGYHVFTYSIANFPTFRCLEQIRNDVAYHNLPVTVVSVGGGLAYGSLGYSHHAVQDYAVMRPLPGMTIAAPGDPWETRASVQWLCENPRPSYLRLGKAGEPVFHSAQPPLAPGSLLLVKAAASKAKAKAKAKGIFLTTGAALGYALEAAASPLLEGGWSVYSLPVWGETVKNAVAEALRAHVCVVVVEDHLEAGGFGSFIREAMRGDTHVALRTLSLDPKVCGTVASQTALNKLGGLDASCLIQAALTLP